MLNAEKASPRSAEHRLGTTPPCEGLNLSRFWVDESASTDSAEGWTQRKNNGSPHVGSYTDTSIASRGLDRTRILTSVLIQSRSPQLCGPCASVAGDWKLIRADRGIAPLWLDAKKCGLFFELADFLQNHADGNRQEPHRKQLPIRGFVHLGAGKKNSLKSEKDS